MLHKKSIWSIAIILLGLAFNSQVFQEKKEIKTIKEAIYFPGKRGEEITRTSALKDYVKYITSYDENGELIESLHFSEPDSILARVVKVKNKNGKIELINVYDDEENLKSSTKCKVDRRGNITSKKTYSKGKKLVSKVLLQYDKNSNVTFKTVVSYTNSKKWLTRYIYNDKNQLVEEIRFFPIGIKDRRVFIYDDNKNRVKSVVKKVDLDKPVYMSTFDDYDNMIVQKWYDDDGDFYKTTRFEFVYDANGNWITKKRFSNNKLMLIWEREIEYY